MENVGVRFGHLKNFEAIKYILGPMGNLFSGNLVYIYFPILVHCAKKNLATLYEVTRVFIN
jgi:hypothetical protein